MRSRDLVGKTVAKVHQTRSWNDRIQQMDVSLDSIEFTDGTKIFLRAGSNNDEDFVYGEVVKP